MSDQAVIPRLDLGSPQYDQSTYVGRAKHFFIVTNPLNILKSPTELEKAKEIVNRCKSGDRLPNFSDDQIWKAKYVYDSAFHPDTGEKMMLIGRMSAQVPMNMCITGCMLTFYRTTPQAVFWQWVNQTFNAVVNYTNRSGDTPINPSQLGISYCLATSGAVGTALGLNALVKRFPPVVGRFVPFFAVAAANCINIPFMRSKELLEGLPVTDEENNRIGNSKVAARSAISQVVLSRIVMAAPGMFIPPIIMSHLEKKAFLKKFPALNAPIQVSLVGFFLLFATPLCCALFPQQSSSKLSQMEPEVQQRAIEMGLKTDRVYFNKGL